MFEILKNQQLNNSVVLMDVYAPFIAKKAQAGQFIIFRVDEKGERVPLTIADYDREKGIITIIFQTIGKATMSLASKKVGEQILDFVGPLGVASHFDNVKKVAVVGGGVGCAIAYPQAKMLHNMGVEVDIIAGFRNKEIVILEDEMKKVSSKLIITTDDGSYGEKGFVTNALLKLIEDGAKYDAVVAIGPVPMMKFICELTRPYKIKTIVSLNPIMVDGTGMCGGCRVTVDGKVKFACVDGPDFDGHDVDFDELMKRNSIYKVQEQKDANHFCNLLSKEVVD
jgi:ferredoxin--NADP+ reductase